MTTNMLSTKRRRSKRPYIIATVLILACVAGGTAFALSVINKPNPKEETTSEEESTPTDSTEGTSDGDIAPAGVSGEDKFNEIPQYEGEDPNTLEELTGSLTFAQVSDNNLVIRVNIDQYLTSGTCSLSLSNGYAAEAAIIPTGSIYSSCEGFDIPVSSLPSGTLNINIRLSSDGKTGTITGSVNL